MRLQNDITDQFIDAEYQYLTETDSNASLDWLDSVALDSTENVLEDGSVRVTDKRGEHFGGFRTKDFSELNMEAQDIYYES